MLTALLTSMRESVHGEAGRRDHAGEKTTVSTTRMVGSCLPNDSFRRLCHVMTRERASCVGSGTAIPPATVAKDKPKKVVF